MIATKILTKAPVKNKPKKFASKCRIQLLLCNNINSKNSKDYVSRIMITIVMKSNKIDRGET